MRFLIKQAGAGGERIGTLSGFAKSQGTIETPTAALFTKGGSVANLTADVLTKVFTNSQLLWVPLSSSIHLENGIKAQGEGISKFVGLPNQVTCMAFNDLNETTPSGHFESDLVPLWTRHGKKMISAQRYIELMELFRPDIILAVSDSRTSLNEAHKRVRKSVDRTCCMLDSCISRYKESTQLRDSALIGVIVGVSRQKEGDECIQHVLKHKDILHGIALSGLSEGGDKSENATVEQLEPIFKKVQESTPDNLLRIVEGCWNPAVVVAAIERGWDVFDGSYPNKLTNLGHALKLRLEQNEVSGELCILDLNDCRYKEDFKPILDGCECLACKKHTRAYINHLLNTREMLAQVLLSIHNLHHFDAMFRAARHSIATNTFQDFKHLITKQYEAYKETQVKVDKSDTDITCENGQKECSKKIRM